MEAKLTYPLCKLDSALHSTRPLKREKIEAMEDLLESDRVGIEVDCVRGLYVEYLLRQISHETANPPDQKQRKDSNTLAMGQSQFRIRKEGQFDPRVVEQLGRFSWGDLGQVIRVVMWLRSSLVFGIPKETPIASKIQELQQALGKLESSSARLLQREARYFYVTVLKTLAQIYANESIVIAPTDSYLLLRSIVTLESLGWGSNQAQDVGLYHDKVVERLLHFAFAKLPDSLKGTKDQLGKAELSSLIAQSKGE